MLQQLQQAITANTVSLPSVPEVAHYLQTQMDRPGFDLVSLVRLIEKDPALTARVVQIAKSAVYRSIQPIEGVRDAVMRIGLTTTKTIAFSQLRQSAFSATQKVISQGMDNVWQRSIHVAAIASVLARRYRLTSPDRAMLGGLLHDIGSMLLLSYLDKAVEFNNEIQNMDPMLDLHGKNAGTMLLKHWGMDPELIDVVDNRHNWGREHTLTGDLTDVVLVSCCYYFACVGEVYQKPLFHTIPAYKKLGLPPDNMGEAIAVLSAASEEIEAVRTALSL